MTYVKSIGSRRELFVDDWLIEKLRDVSLKLHPPLRREEVLKDEDFGYAAVFRDDAIYRMYYRTGGKPYGYNQDIRGSLAGKGKAARAYGLCRESGRYPLGKAGIENYFAQGV